MRFIFLDSRHNLSHWLTVVFIKIIFFLIILPLSLYLVAIGFLLSGTTIRPYLPFLWFAKIAFYSAQLPYLQLSKQFFISQLNHWYKDAPVWWTIVVGIPLILMGISLFLINFFNLYYSIFGSLYNRTHCPFCQEPIKAKIS